MLHIARLYQPLEHQSGDGLAHVEHRLLNRDQRRRAERGRDIANANVRNFSGTRSERVL
jgi:hypothetical protein